MIFFRFFTIFSFSNLRLVLKISTNKFLKRKGHEPKLINFLNCNINCSDSFDFLCSTEKKDLE